MSDSRFTISCKPFTELSATELYNIMQLRSEVFVVEQNCVYLDADDKDRTSHHLQIMAAEKLAAYSRLLPPGLAYEQMSIGRVVSSPAHRGTGVGKLLISEAIAACYSLFGDGEIKIGAQLYLKKFYESFGFRQAGEMYLEDEIEHIPMVL